MYFLLQEKVFCEKTASQPSRVRQNADTYSGLHDFGQNNFFGATPRRRGFGLPAAFCSEKAFPWVLGSRFSDFQIVCNQKRRGISPEVASTEFQPVMFGMDPFGGKSVNLCFSVHHGKENSPFPQRPHFKY